MSVREAVVSRIEQALAACEADGLWPREQRTAIVLERPKQAEHGDLATNVAMTLAKAAKKNPREVAAAIVAKLGAGPDDLVLSGAELAGPGFINLRISRKLYYKDLQDAVAQGKAWGRSAALAGQKVIVEFVSANPTGPMHVGHGRGAVTGDVIARLLDAAGAKVHREYYINDAGGQVGHLAHATYVRLQQQLESKGVKPEALTEQDYQGAYIADIAKELIARVGEADALAIAKTPFAEVKTKIERLAVDIVMTTMIRPDLEYFNIPFDQFYSEREMHEAGRVVKALDELEKKGVAAMMTLPPPKGLERDPDAPVDDRPLLVMKTSQFGDDVDRPLRKTDGAYTYFAGDVAYHWDKLQRGFTRIINIWGADHAGYVARVRAAIQALGFDPKSFEVVLVQMVNLVRNGEPVKMGKRSGNFVTLRDQLESAGPDATRIFFIQRSSNSQFDFDLALAEKQTDENPVFYVQYGHARACSILRKAKERGLAIPAVTVENLAGLQLPEELELIKRILTLPDMIAGAAQSLEPHRVVFWMQETIAAFHSYLTKYKNTEKVLSDDVAKTTARLALVEALRLTLANVLGTIGVSAPEEMRRETVEE